MAIIDFDDEIVRSCLPALLKDKTTQGDISLPADVDINALRPRSMKSQGEQSERTRKNAEVFTPAWLCREMIDYLHDECELNSKPWKEYIDLRFIEITCGEAPFIVSRYDAVAGKPTTSATGQSLELEDRAGILDRKLKVINDNVPYRDQWFKYVLRAYQSVYGYELQGDSLLIARLNLLLTFVEYHDQRWKDFSRDEIFAESLAEIVEVIAWNFWQMDGLDVPDESPQLSMFDTPDSKPDCLIRDWRTGRVLRYHDVVKGLTDMGKKLFDFCVSNPPYQDDTVGDQKQFAPPVYDKFMNEAYEIADVAELITPARFLFGAGATSREWNEKMLSDPHMKVLKYEPDSRKVFRSADIKGGVAVTIRDERKNYGAIGVFTAFPELNSIFHKVVQNKNFETLSSIVYSRTSYRLTEDMHKENPHAINQLSAGHPYDMSSNIMELLPEIFYQEKPNDGHEYTKFLGLIKSKRVHRWLRRDYMKFPDNFEAYKVLVPKSNGSGALGEVLSTPVIGLPVIGHTETFISIGCYDNLTEAENTLKYIKTKFARAMLGILKVTQDNPRAVWRYVPLQNFKADSDIDWSQPIPEIDRQLYRKYNLSDDEIAFIEEHVREMQ